MYENKRNLIKVFFDNLTRRIQILEQNQSNNINRIEILENDQKNTEEIGKLEETQSKRISALEVKHKAMNDAQLRTELKAKYGESQWSSKLIDEIISHRPIKNLLKRLAG